MACAPPTHKTARRADRERATEDEKPVLPPWFCFFCIRFDRLLEFPCVGQWIFVRASRRKQDTRTARSARLPEEHHESTARRYPESDFFEADGVLALNYLHSSGFGCGISGTLVHQYYFDNRYLNVKGEHRTETLFGLLDAKVSYEFPGKRGFVAVQGKNLTNTRFTYQREAVALDAFYPDRQIVFTLGWYF